MKTEKPTNRRLLKEAKKGNSFNSRDLTAASALLSGVIALGSVVSLWPIANMYKSFIDHDFQIAPQEAAMMAFRAFGYAAAPVALICIAVVAVISLAMSKGALAFEAVKINFGKLNPINGFKNLFSVKVVKDFIRAVLYTVLACLFAWMTWLSIGPTVFSQVYASGAQLGGVWAEIAFSSVVGLLLALAPIYLLSGLADYVLFIRDLKMEKHEVKQEHKDNEGSQEIKQRRREIGKELSAQVQADVAGSTLVLANPTHIAVGIYVHEGSVGLPFVSVREQGARARAVIALAERLGVPVVRDVRVARSVFASCARYRFVQADNIERVMDVVRWLRDVEAAGREPLEEASSDEKQDGGKP